MSRSYKHHNICANTCCGYDGSEKKDKQRANRKHRSKCNQILKKHSNDREDFSEISNLPLLREVDNKCTWLKDGKHLIVNWKNCPDKSLHFTKDGKLKR